MFSINRPRRKTLGFFRNGFYKFMRKIHLQYDPVYTESSYNFHARILSIICTIVLAIARDIIASVRFSSCSVYVCPVILTYPPCRLVKIRVPIVCVYVYVCRAAERLSFIYHGDQFNLRQNRNLFLIGEMAAKHFEVRIKRLLSNECKRRMDVNTVELMVETERELIAEETTRARENIQIIFIQQNNNVKAFVCGILTVRILQVHVLRIKQSNSLVSASVNI